MNKNHVPAIIAGVLLLVIGVGCERCDQAAGIWYIDSTGADIALSNDCDGQSRTRLHHIDYRGKWERYCLFRVRATVSAELDNGVTRTLVVDFNALPGFLGRLTGLGLVEISDCVNDECAVNTYRITSIRKAPDAIE